ncbi:transient receptor potential channel pyrexia-like isoform X2 [Bacillus rossius redtenbacheri]|uniref:transient receptor potential channel pyrexia-like isoform X2 n=1 Tax=Bacillus rossius redtenbacheri TaxID=93214 RepID=UPI002FDE6B74
MATCGGACALVAAAEGGSPDDVRRALEAAGDAAADVANTARGRLRVTALQLAAARGGGAGEEAARLLLGAGALPSAADKLGRAPLHHAAQACAPGIVRLLLEAGAAPDPRFGVAREEPDGGEQACPHASAGCQLALPECWGRTPLHLAARAGDPPCVRLLLGAGADPQARDEQGFTPLLLAGGRVAPDDPAAVSRFEEVVSALLAAGADPNARASKGGGTALHAAAALRSEAAARRLLAAGARASGPPGAETPLHVAAASGSLAVAKVLVDRGPAWIVNAADEEGRTPLHRAATAGARDVLALLARRSGDLSAEDSCGLAVVDVVFACVPRPVLFLAELLDSCVLANSASVNDNSFEVELDFGLLAAGGPTRQMAVLMAAASAGSTPQLTELLQHPLPRAFLWFKWRRLRVFFFAVLAAHACFVASLSAHAVARVCGPHSAAEVLVSRRLLLASSLLLLAHLAGQVAAVPRRTLRQPETWLNACAVALAACVGAWGEARDGGGRLAQGHWVRHVFSALVLLAWAELMLLVGRFPTWGYYALMFYNVLQNVVKVLLTFVCLVIGFAFSFLIQFQEDPQFANLWRSLVKTTVMMTGEFDYGDLFAEPDEAAGNSTSAARRLPATSRAIFLLFVVLASIVLMNLMVGLAVSDIQALQTEGIVHRLLKQAAFAEQLEKMSDGLMRARYIPRLVRRALDARRTIRTKVVIAPSTNSRSPDRLPYAVLEAVTLTGLRNRQLKEAAASPAPSGSTAAYAGMEDASVAGALGSIQQELSEMRQLLNMLHGVHQRSSLPAAPLATRGRFSQAAAGIHEAQGVLRSIRHGRKTSRAASRV